MVFAVLLFTFHSTSSISSSFSTSPHLSTTHDETESQIGGHTGSFFDQHSMFIGRIMAWVCTVLYLNSRMPQIWKNVCVLNIFFFFFFFFYLFYFILYSTQESQSKFFLYLCLYSQPLAI